MGGQGMCESRPSCAPFYNARQSARTNVVVCALLERDSVSRCEYEEMVVLLGHQLEPFLLAGAVARGDRDRCGVGVGLARRVVIADTGDAGLGVLHLLLDV